MTKKKTVPKKAPAKSKEEKNSKLGLGAVLEELKTPGLIILGMVGGNMAGKLIDKVIKVDETATGIQPKAFIKPVVQITAGVGGALFLKDKNLKLIASGIAASGIASSVKVFLKKDILQGLTNFAGLGETAEVKNVFREPINLQIEPYYPNLPALTGGGDENEIDGIAKIPVETDDFSGTELGDYTEIKEVQIL